MRDFQICHMTVAHRNDDVRIFEKECASLAAFGYDVSLVSPGIKDFNAKNVHVYGVRVGAKPLCRLFFGARKIYEKALSLNADIYHFHDIELFRYGLKMKKMGKKVIFDSHEDWIGYVQEISWLPVWSRRLATHMVRRLYRKRLGMFDAIISVSPNIISELKNFSNKVFMVGNYPIVNTESCKNFSYEDYAKRNNILVYAGTVYQDSNQLFIITSIRDINDVKYYIVGNVDKDLAEQIKEKDVSARVVFCGFVEHEEVVRYYDKSIAGMSVLSYSPHSGGRTGTLGLNKLFEYMYAGLPVICSDQILWKERIINKYHCGIAVKPEDVNQIKSAIEFIINNKREAYEMGLAGKKAVLEEFNWKTQEENLLKVYKFVIDNEKCEDNTIA